MPQRILAPSEDMTQREAAERALRDAQEFQSRLIACSQDCIKMLDLEGRLLWMNEGGMQALEICDLGPFANSSWLQFWEGDDAKAARGAVETARKGGTGRFTGYCATTTTKQPRWWDVVVSSIRDAAGKPERLLAVSRDVTEYNRNEKALSEAHLQVVRSGERWRSVFENSAIGVALTDPNGRFLATNPVFQKMVGYTEEELRALSFLDISHADYREANWALVAELLEGKRRQFQIEKRYRCKDGSLIWDTTAQVSKISGKLRRGGTYSKRHIDAMSVRYQWIERRRSVGALPRQLATSPTSGPGEAPTQHDEATSVVLFEPIKQFLLLIQDFLRRSVGDFGAGPLRRVYTTAPVGKTFRRMAKRHTQHDEASSVVLFEPIKQFPRLIRTLTWCFQDHINSPHFCR